MTWSAPVNFAPIFEIEGVGGFALNEQGALMRVGHVAHQFRVTKPAIGYDDGRGQLKAAPGQRGEGLIEHGLRPLELGVAAPPRSLRVGPSHRKVNGHDQSAIANDHEQQHPINTANHALVLSTVPVAHQFEGTAIFAEDGIVDHRGELPAAARRRAHRLGASPNGADDVLAELSQAFKPGAFR